MLTSRSRHEQLLVQLHVEMRSSRGEMTRAAELRDEMETSWYELSAAEQELFDDLSEDLYIIEGKRVAEPLSAGETPEGVLTELSLAFQVRDYKRLLVLVRKLPRLEARHIFIIARCWGSQGFSRAAVCFFDYANELEPSEILEIAALESMVHTEGMIDEALARAKAIEDRKVVSSVLVLQVAKVLYRASQDAEGGAKNAMLARVTQLVEGAGDDPANPSWMRSLGYLTAGWAYEQLGDMERASYSFDRAVAADPSDLPLLARGLVLLGIDPDRAVRDFKQAVNLRTRIDWPYLYTALDVLKQGRFAEVEKICKDGLAVTDRSEVRGRLLEWLAISATRLGRPPAEVVALFDAAAAELPLDLVIHSNRKKYRDSLVKNARSDDFDLNGEIGVSLAQGNASLMSGTVMMRTW